MRNVKDKSLVLLAVLMIFSPATIANANFGERTITEGTHNYLENKVAESAFYKVGSPYKVKGKQYTPKFRTQYEKIGMASWYGTQFHGKRTANGDVFDKNELTAAHPTLPMFSVVKVTNLENGKTVRVVINDRGPFAKDRILDLSEAAAKRLGFHKKGTAEVKVEYSKNYTEAYLKKIGLYNQYQVIAQNY